MRIIEAEAHHVDPAWRVMDRCKRALADAGIRQWDDAYPTRDIVDADVRRELPFWCFELDVRTSRGAP
jgi:hypothetical protein